MRAVQARGRDIVKRASWLNDNMARQALRAYREAARCNPVTERDGRDWYNAALVHAHAFARHHHVSVNCAAGVIAVLSPQHTWDQNLKLAEVCLGGGTPRCFKKTASLACAIRDANGMPDTALMGPKVGAFYRAIMGHQDAVVIDRWMLRAMGMPDARLTRKRYAVLAQVVRDVAKEHCESASTFQAIVWCQIRGKSF